MGRKAHIWPRFTSDQWVLDMVTGLSIELQSIPVQVEIPDSASSNSEKDALLHTQIGEMLQQGILEPAFPSRRAFVSHLFLRPKSNGTFRPILNLSNLNEFTVYRHFKMDHLCSVMQALPKASYMASVDITQAYHSLQIRSRDRDLLQLQHHGRRYRSLVCQTATLQAPGCLHAL